MVQILLNDEDCSVGSVEELDEFLGRVARTSPCDLWLGIGDGPSLCMLKQSEFSWLMYLRFSGNSGFYTIGDIDAKGKATFTLGNGQVDEYPIAFCIELEQALKAISYFWINEGRRPDWIEWRESRPGDGW